MRDLRLVVQKLLRDWGQDILLQRRIFHAGKGPYALNRTPTDSSALTPSQDVEGGDYGANEYNTGTYAGLPEGDTDLEPVVDESYFSNKLERWTVHYTMATRKTQIPDLMQGRMEGLSISAPLIAYWTYDAAPTEGDRVYIRDSRFGNELTTWIIRYSEQVVGNYGQVTFYLTGMFREETPASLSGR